MHLNGLRAASSRSGNALPLLRLHGGSSGVEMVDQSTQAYEWTVNIATAAALVAGASLASLFDHGLHVELRDFRTPGGRRFATLIHNMRMFSSVLLALAFAFEIETVFVATVTGTMLLSRGRSAQAFDPSAFSAMELLHRQLEFEYCLIRAGFFQGLLNWLSAIGLRFFVSLATPMEADMVEWRNGSIDTPARQRQRLALGVGLMLTMFALVMMMVSFYNYHLNYYDNYPAMLTRLRHLAWHRYIACQPRRVLPLCAFATLLGAIGALGWAFALPSRDARDEAVASG